RSDVEHVATSPHVPCRVRRVELVECRRQSCPELFRCRALGTRGIEPLLRLLFREGARALRWQALLLRLGRTTQCNLQALSCLHKAMFIYSPLPVSTSREHDILSEIMSSSW